MHIRADGEMPIAYCVCEKVWVFIYVNIGVVDGGGRISLCVKV